MSVRDYMKTMLTRYGKRFLVLVYRSNPLWDGEVIRAQSCQLADIFFGDRAKDHLIGIYRADDDHKVYEDEKLAYGQPLQHPVKVHGLAGSEPLLEKLGSLEPRELRAETTRGKVEALVEEAGVWLKTAKLAHSELEIYSQALRIALNEASWSAVQDFPLEDFRRRLREEFEGKSPRHVKLMRGTGRVVSWPTRKTVEGVSTAYHYVKDRWSGAEPPGGAPADPVEAGLDLVVKVAAQLRVKCDSDRLVVELSKADNDVASLVHLIKEVRAGLAKVLSSTTRTDDDEPEEGMVRIHAAIPSALKPRQEELRGTNWSDRTRPEPVADKIRETLRDLVTTLVRSGLDSSFDDLIKSIARQAREKMGFWAKVRETAFASLHVVPPAVGVVWVLSTGDPVMAMKYAAMDPNQIVSYATVFGSVKVTATQAALFAKVQGVFGWNDLYATFAIPADWKIDEKDRENLLRMINPALQRWVKTQTDEIRKAFGKHVAGLLLEEADRRLMALPTFGLRLMSPLGDPSGMPMQERNVILIAPVRDVLHVRIFDADGILVMDTDETNLALQGRQTGELRKQLETLWPPRELTEGDREKVLSALAPVVGHNLMGVLLERAETAWEEAKSLLRQMKTVTAGAHQ